MLAVLRFVALRHAFARPGRALLTALGVTVGVALYVAIALVNRATLEGFRESVTSLTGTASLTVLAGRTGFPAEIVDKVRATDGVSHAVGMIETTAYYDAKDGSSKTLSVLGLDLLNEAAVRTYKAGSQEVLDDPLVFLNQPDSVIVTTELAKRAGLGLDQKLVLATAYGTKEFTIRGLLSPEGPAKAHGGALAIMDIDAAQLSFGRPDTVDRVDVVLRQGASPDAVRARLVAALGPGYRVEDPTGQTRRFEAMVGSFQQLLGLVSALALLVAVFLVGNTVAMSVAERRREIGVLRAIGASRGAIVTVFLAEAAVTGTVAAAFGVALGSVAARLMADAVAVAMTAQLSTTVAIAAPALGPREAIVGIALGGFTAAVAALLPARRASLVHPLEAIRPAAPSERAVTSRAGRARALGPVLLLLVLVSSKAALAERAPLLAAVDPLLAVAGSVLSASWFVDAALRGLRRLGARAPLGRARPLVRLACDNLAAKPARTASNVLGLMVALLLVVVVAALGTSFKTSLVAWFDEMLAADVFVSAAGDLASGGQVQPLHESLGRELAQVPGVRARTDGTVTAMRVAHGRYAGEEVGLKAWDTPDRTADFAQFALRDGPREDSRALYEGEGLRAIVSENFATNFGKKRGDTIELESPSGPRRFTIVGTVTDFAHPKGIVYMKRAVYKELWGDPLVTAFMVRVEGGSIESVRSAIDSRFGRRGIFTHTLSELKAGVVRTVDQATAALHAIETLTLVVALVGLLNTLSASVLERFRELGTYRALGMSRAQLAGLVLTESLLQGGLAGVSASLLGVYLSWAYLVGSLSRAMGFVLAFSFPWAATLIAVLAGLFASALAGWLPARRAAALPVVEALRQE